MVRHGTATGADGERKELNSPRSLGVSGQPMLRSRIFLLWIIPVLLFAGVCYPLVDVLDGPGQLGMRGDFPADEHTFPHSGYCCVAAVAAKGSRWKTQGKTTQAFKYSPGSVAAISNPLSEKIADSSTNETVLLLDRRWQFLRRSALEARAPDTTA
jgi:hypothetical protein